MLGRVMSAIALREARPAELDTIGETMVAAYAEFSPPDPPPQWLEYIEEIRDVRRRLASSTLIVAEDGGRIVGAVTYYPDGSKEPNGGWRSASNARAPRARTPSDCTRRC
jgi:hypothetical protein